MADYLHADDGKIHTRYSELIRCTPGQIDRVIWERTHPNARTQTDSMGFGIVRHEMFDEEARVDGRLPRCFGLERSADFIEHEFATEILPGVVVHSRPDVVSLSPDLGNAIVDYKTVLDGRQGWKAIVNSYKHVGKQRQLLFYAFQLGLHGIRITKGMFLCEIWNETRDEIVGYKVIEFPIMLRDIAPVLPWVKDRVALLAAVLEEQKAFV